MNRRLLYILMASVGVLLTGLIVIQVLWLRKASETEQQVRRLSVEKALASAEDALQNMDYCVVSYSKTYIDSGEAFYMMRVTKDQRGDTVAMFYDERFTADGKMKSKGMVSTPFPFAANIKLNFDAMFEDNASYEKEREQFNEDLAAKNYKTLITGRRRIDSVYDMKLIDSIIRKSLTKDNYDTAYAFGFIYSDEQKVAYAQAGADTAALLRSAYSIPIFPENHFIRPHRLALVFPQDGGMYRLHFWLICSLGVVLLLMLSFYVFVRVFIKQTNLSQMKSDFIHNLTHEFNTPLANISLAIETLEGTAKNDDEKTMTILSIIAAESARLRENIERSLQVATFEEGAMQLHKEMIDLCQLVTTVVSGYQLQCEALGGGITLSLPAKAMVYADEAHILNCVVNLLDNAIKYRKGPPGITVAVEAKGAEVLLTVADNGIGMTANTQKHIFEKFYRAHEGDIHNTKGFGLGLCYVKGVVELHSGSITVWSKMGSGAKFTIRLPANERYGSK